MSNRPNRRPTRDTSNRVAEARGAGSGSNGLLIGGAVAVVLVLALLVAVFVGRDTGIPENDPTLTAEPVSVTGTALPTFDKSLATDPAVGMTLPTMTGDDLDGQPLTIAPSGNPQMIVYLAHWCPHCQNEVPELVTWLSQGGNGDVEVRGVTTGIDAKKPNYPPTKWLKSENWTVPTLIDPSGLAAESSGLSGYPYFVFVNAQGAVTARVSGELTIDEINSLLVGARSGSEPSPGTIGDQGPSSPADG